MNSNTDKSPASLDLFFDNEDHPSSPAALKYSSDEWLACFDCGSSQELLDGDACYYPNFIPSYIADICFDHWQKNITWQHDTIKIYGREVLIPRLQCWLGKEGLSYQYSGKELIAKLWPNNIENLANALSQACDTRFNSVLANLYRDGDDSMGWHADDEIELGEQPIIASITLGMPRDFTFRRVGTSKTHSKINLGHGSLLLMKAGMQDRWQHALPKRKKIHTQRLNLTFRNIVYSRS